MKPHPDISWRTVEGQGICIQNREGMIHVLNAAGTLLWEHLNEGPEAMARRLVENYGLEPDQAARDVEEFLDQLRRLGMVVEE